MAGDFVSTIVEVVNESVIVVFVTVNDFILLVASFCHAYNVVLLAYRVVNHACSKKVRIYLLSCRHDQCYSN